MKIQIHIERLILEGIDVPPGQRPLLQTAVETELATLLRNGDLAPDLQSGGAYRARQGRPIHLQNTHPPTLGRQIAAAVHGGIGK